MSWLSRSRSIYEGGGKRPFSKTAMGGKRASTPPLPCARKIGRGSSSMVTWALAEGSMCLSLQRMSAMRVFIDGAD